MMRGRHRVARAVLVAVGIAAPAFAIDALTMNDPDGLGSQNPGLDVTRHAMPPPDITAKPANDAPNGAPQSAGEATPAVSANPLWAIPMSSLVATRNRPLFTPSRRPPAPVVANAPPPLRPPPPPPPPAPEHPNLTLVGTVAGENEGVAVFIIQGTRDTVRLRTGEGRSGWILQSVDHSTATMQKGDQTETLAMPRPTEMQAAAPPIISPLPPPLPPPPQSGPPAPQRPPPPQLGQPTPPRPQSDLASPPNPQLQGCAPPPVGC